MKCQEAKELIFSYVKNELDEKMHAAMQAHLEACEACRKEVEDIRTVLALIESASDEKIINMVNNTILDAINNSAETVHIEPEPGSIRVRIRRYGVLHELNRLPIEAKSAMAARIKMMADMKVSERRAPQDGRIMSTQLPGIDRELDLRVACSPTIFGEAFVMHILDRSSALLGLDNLEISPEQLSQIRSMTDRGSGLILVTGPSGSGKTTLLYSILMHANSDELKLITIEDPVEYALKGVTQIPVWKAAGLTFASGLRSIMRQDPDVIMVGTTNDLEIAMLEVQVALAGHMVLSSLHTIDAPSGLIRMVDLGVEPYIVTSAVSGIISQRLVRRVCDNCREEYSPDAEALKTIGFRLQDVPKTRFYHGRGCEKCDGKGYTGLTPITEVLVMNQETAELLNKRAPLIDLRESAIRNGMIPMAADARRKVIEGLTTAEEAARVLGINTIV